MSRWVAIVVSGGEDGFSAKVLLGSIVCRGVVIGIEFVVGTALTKDKKGVARD